MTDPQTPATEARRRFRRWVFNEINGGDFGDVWTQEFDRLLDAIEAEARADVDRGAESVYAYQRGRADALREAAERVRALRPVEWVGAPHGHTVSLAAVLAILDPQP